MGASRARDKAARRRCSDHGGATLSRVGWWGPSRTAQTTRPGHLGYAGGASRTHARCSGSVAIVERSRGTGPGMGRTARTTVHAVRWSERACGRANVGFAHAGIDTRAGRSGLGLTSTAVATRAAGPLMGRPRAFSSGALMGRTAGPRCACTAGTAGTGTPDGRAGPARRSGRPVMESSRRAVLGRFASGSARPGSHSRPVMGVARGECLEASGAVLERSGGPSMGRTEDGGAGRSAGAILVPTVGPAAGTRGTAVLDRTCGGLVAPRTCARRTGSPAAIDHRCGAGGRRSRLAHPGRGAE